MNNSKWQIGPVKLVGGYEAHLDFFCESRQIWIGRFRNNSGQWHGADWDPTGRHENLTQGMGLAPPPKKTVRVQAWLMVCRDGAISVFFHKNEAIENAKKNGFALIEIDHEIEEGEGL